MNLNNRLKKTTNAKNKEMVTGLLQPNIQEKRKNGRTGVCTLALSANYAASFKEQGAQASGQSC